MFNIAFEQEAQKEFLKLEKKITAPHSRSNFRFTKWYF